MTAPRCVPDCLGPAVAGRRGRQPLLLLQPCVRHDDGVVVQPWQPPHLGSCGPRSQAHFLSPLPLLHPRRRCVASHPHHQHRTPAPHAPLTWPAHRCGPLIFLRREHSSRIVCGTHRWQLCPPALVRLMSALQRIRRHRQPLVASRTPQQPQAGLPPFRILLHPTLLLIPIMGTPLPTEVVSSTLCHPTPFRRPHTCPLRLQSPRQARLTRKP